MDCAKYNTYTNFMDKKNKDNLRLYYNSLYFKRHPITHNDKFIYKTFSHKVEKSKCKFGNARNYLIP
jgi:hypothetical protein